MVSVYGEVGPLQNLKKVLSQYGFKIDSINDYLIECEKIKEKEQNISSTSESMFIDFVDNLENDIRYLIYIKRTLEKDINEYSLYVQIIKKIKAFFIIRKLKYLESKNLNIRKNQISYIENFSHKLQKEIDNKKGILEQQKQNYYGAIAEIEVQKEIQKLYLNSKLLNNFEKRFQEAIPMKGGRDWIKSVQIDHIVINQKGIFLIETKNWSKAFEKTQTFTPLSQAKRHGHGFYFYFRNDFKEKVGFYPRIYNVVARKQYIKSAYNKEFNTYEMSIGNLNYFIQTRKTELNDIQVEIIFNTLKTFVKQL